MNGHLASVHDGFTNAVLQGEGKKLLNSTKEFWIGLNTLLIPGNWSWTDSTIFDFKEWSPSEPQNISQICASLTILNGYWKSDDCFVEKSYACKISSTITTTTIAATTISPSYPPSYPAYINCTEGWIYFEPTHSCYGHDGYTEQIRNWSSGEQYCQSVDGHLPSIHSYDEARFLITLVFFTYPTIWTGLKSYDNETSWKWSDNSPVDYLPWGSGYPNSNVSSCARMERIAFYDVNCEEPWPVICKKLSNVTNIPTPTVTPSYPAYQNCTEGWVYFEPTHSCYGHDGYTQPFGNWSEAEQYCKSAGGHLPSLHSYDETRFLSTGAGFGGGYLWTGLKSNDNQVSWAWSDDSLVDYLPWASGYPKLNGSSSAHLYENALYNFDSINIQHFICKKPVISIKVQY